MVGFPYLYCAGGTLPTVGGGFLMVTTFSLLSVVSFQREKGKIVMMSTPDPSSLSLDKNNNIGQS